MLTKQAINPKELLINLRQQGIKLWEENNKIKFKAPKEVINNEILQALKENKTEILEILKSENTNQTVKPDIQNRYQHFPLTDIQSAYLLGRNEAFGYGGVACHLYLEFNYDHLDHSKTEKVWNKLIQRHEMLRAEISKEGHQRIMKEAPAFSVKYTDLETKTGTETQEQLNGIRNEMDHKVYDTDQWPLFDIRLTKTKNNSTLHFSMEFLIADWASMWMLLSEFEYLYDNIDKELPLPELSFRDYLIAERKLQETHTYIKDKEYWMNRVSDLPSAPQLPLARKQDTSSGKFLRKQLQINLADWNKLKQQSQKYGITPTAAVLTAYAAVIERWSRNHQFCLNLTILNRLPLHKQVHNIVGDFTSVNLLEINWKKGQTFVERAKNNNTRLFDDLDHRLFTGVEVIREITRQKGKENALMPIVFTSAIGLTPASEENLLKGKMTENSISQTPQVFLDCQAMDTAEGLLANWDYRKGVFPENMIDDMFDAFENLLHLLATNEKIWQENNIIQLPNRQDFERKKANNTKGALPRLLLHQPVIEQIKRNPHKTAIVDAYGETTYKQLGIRASAVYAELIKQGCKPQDKVAVTMPKSAYQVISVLGCLSAQAVYVPIDITQPEARRFKIIENAQINYILTTKNTELTFPEKSKIIVVDDLPLQENINLKTEGDINLPAYVIYTSGSTGQPKGVVISHQAAQNTIIDINKRFEVNENDVVLGLSQLGFDLSVYDIFGLLAKGGKIVYPQADRHVDPSHWAELMQKNKVSIWNTVPALMQILANYLNSDKSVELHDLRLALLSGDWIPLHMPDELKQRIPEMQLVSLGGATEASIWSNFHIYKKLQPDWVSIPYGKPLTNQGFRVMDTDMRDCPEWVPGDLYITGDGLALGYLGDEKLSAERFFNHCEDGQYLYKTGDLGRYTPDGDLEFLGREDKQVKIKGHRIELGEIESAIQQHSSVGNARVMITDSNNGKSLSAFIQTATNTCRDKQKEKNKFEQQTADIHQKSSVLAKHLKESDIQDGIQKLDNAIFYSILRAFQEINYFKNNQKTSIEQLLESGKINSKFHWIVKRWIAKLVQHGLLQIHEDNNYSTSLTTDTNTENNNWIEAYSAWESKKIGSDKFIEYLKNNALALPGLLEGSTDPVSLLFPDGKSDYVRALYIDNTIVQYLNNSICILMKRIVEENPQKQLKILEIGAGTGATTEKILETLKDHQITYLYTDIIPSFITKAKAKFKNFSNVQFGVYDIDKSYREQGLAPNSFDIIVAAGVLENSGNIPQAMKNIRELICPDGWFIYTEPTREHPWILISQAFMMKEPNDELRTNTSYLDKQAWLDLTQKYGNQQVLNLPGEEDKLSLLGLHMFATQMKKDRMPLTISELSSFLGRKIPAYMMPSHMQIIDNLPLTGNGKINLKKLKEWEKELHRNEKDNVPGSDSNLESELEKQLASMWSGALGLPKIGRNDNFYEHGSDSLIMSQMAGKIRDEFSGKEEIPFDTLLSNMLNTPTVAALAEFIELYRKAEKNGQEISTITPGNKNIGAYTNFGGGQKGPLRLILPAGLGTMDCFMPLINLLKAQNLGPVLGVSVADIKRYCNAEPDELIEDVAEDYAQYIIESGYKQVQIIGYCLGCLSAVEVARRLQENGIEIVDLILIDGHRVPFIIEDEIVIETLYLPNLFITMEQAGFGVINSQLLMDWFIKTLRENNNKIPKDAASNIGGTEELDKLGDVFRKMHEYTMEQRFDAYVKAMPDAEGGKLAPEMVLRMFKTYCQSFQAARFAPAPYFGDIRYLQAEDDSSFLPGMSEQIIQFWEEVCLGNFSVGTIEGNHYTCVEPPIVQHVAKKVAEPLLQQKNNNHTNN